MDDSSDRKVAAAHRGPVLSPRITASPAAIEDFCKRWQVAELALFGSVLRDDYSRKSDIDVLVDFVPDGVPGIEFVTMAAELSRLSGRQADVLTRSAVERSRNHIRRRETWQSSICRFTCP
ncbi:MAG: nucleotidyltransferase domain-containing protein [Gammaproteobacteria bacterium]|nr:nucleotidyltransferase domain-containing protein [Gammaproteobacteria bacterium]